MTMKNSSEFLREHADRGSPLLFAIQNFCLQDGPGIRSIVFFKGCPLRCKWCHNPESWSPHRQLAYKQHLCIDCNACAETCPEQAMTAPGNWDFKKCTLCVECVKECPSEALIHFGDRKTVEKIMEEIRPEYTYFKSSKGGVTFSGGEPAMFPEFSEKLTAVLQEENVHVALETCGLYKIGDLGEPDEKSAYDTERLQGKTWNFISKLDLILHDVKVFDRDRFKKLCGADNKLIMQNLRTLAALMKTGKGPPVWPRLPLIPTMTNTEENLVGWARFLTDIGLEHITVIPYHNLGESKKTWIGIEMKNDLPNLSIEDVDRAKQILKREGMTCHDPGGEDWQVLEEAGG